MILSLPGQRPHRPTVERTLTLHTHTHNDATMLLLPPLSPPQFATARPIIGHKQTHMNIHTNRRTCTSQTKSVAYYIRTIHQSIRPIHTAATARPIFADANRNFYANHTPKKCFKQFVGDTRTRVHQETCSRHMAT